ncbi:MAG: thioredoxin family protein [Phycisphaerae bacterium]|nr:thioredoxin family protein [Phycisphaerae bacterium]
MNEDPYMNEQSPQQPKQQPRQQTDVPANAPGMDANSSTGQHCSSCGRFNKIILFGLIVLAGIYYWTARPSPSAVAWIEDYNAGLAQAEKQNMPVLLAFKASWCGPCRQMDNEVFAKPEAADLLKSWVPVHIDVDKNPEIIRKYQSYALPTFIVLSPSGHEVTRISGGMSDSQFAAFLAEAKVKMGSTIAHAPMAKP